LRSSFSSIMRGRHRHHHGVSVSHQPESPPDHIHLSQLHFPTPLPPPVIRRRRRRFCAWINAARTIRRCRCRTSRSTDRCSCRLAVGCAKNSPLTCAPSVRLGVRRDTSTRWARSSPEHSQHLRTSCRSCRRPCPDTGNLHAFVKRPEPALVGAVPGRWCGRGASPRGW